MLHGSPSPGVAGSELAHLLARLARVNPAPARAALAERLGAWLGWSGAVSLSAVIDASPSVARTSRKPSCNAEALEFQRVQAALEAALADGPGEPASSPTDFGPHHRHCITQQRAMRVAVAALRQRLRQALAQQSSLGARLAAIDAVLEQALDAREQGLLALIPLHLQTHFENLQRGAAAAPRWLETFCEDRNHLLRAELAHRLLPAQGLLATLSIHQTR